MLGSIFETGGLTVFGAGIEVFGEGNREDLLDDVGDFLQVPLARKQISPAGDVFYLGPNALTTPIAMGTRATKNHKAGALEFRPAMRIQIPKPTMKAEIT